MKAVLSKEVGGPETLVVEEIDEPTPGKGEALVARAEVVGSGRSQAVVRADVFAVSGGTEKLCATAQGTIMRAASRS